MTDAIETPLSDLIDAVGGGSNQDYSRFLEAFRRSMVGVVAIGASPDTVGEVVSTDAQPIAIGLTRVGDLRGILLAFADPPAFAAKYGQRFNALIEGHALFETALAHQDCAGIRVNSAKAETSLWIGRETILALLGPPKSPEPTRRKPWWKRW